MGTISDKLTYLNDTKTLLKQKINNLGGDITDSTTFRQYADKLQTIYDNAPKTDYEEGSNITLENCLKGKIDFDKEYQEVEYIESTGPAYIDTGFVPNTNTKIDIEFETIQKGTNGVIFGGETTYNSSCFHLYNTSGNFDIGFGSKNTGFATTVPYNLNTKYKFIMDKNGFDVNGTTGTFPEPTISTTISIFLFAVHRGNSSNVIDSNAQKRIYYCKLYDNGTLVRNMIPCYRISDNVIGMYDLVNNKFYTNAGTGAFTKGADVGKGFIDIVGYGDTEQESTTGANLLPNNLTSQTINGLTVTKNLDGTVTINGTATAQTILSVGTVSTSTSQSYKLIGCPSDGGSNKYYITGGNYTDLGSGSTYANAQLTSTAISIVVRNAITCNNAVFKPMLTTVSTKTYADYEQYTGGIPAPNPSYPFPINTVTGEQEVTIRGINLLNIAGGSVAYKPADTTVTIKNNGVINASADMGYASISIPNITLKAGTTYTFKRNFTGLYNSLLVDTNGNNVLGIGYNKTSVTATIESDVTINKLNGALLSGDNYFQLETGSTATDYEPYITPITKQLSLGDKELFEDSFISYENGNFYFNDKYKKLFPTAGTFDTTTSSFNNMIIFAKPLDDIKYDTYQTNTNNKCNKAPFLQTSYSSAQSVRVAGNVYGNMYAFVVSKQTTSSEVADIFNGLYIIYETTNITKTPITDTTLISQLEDIYNIMSLNGTTIIEIDGALPMIMKARALKGE